jgi:hypothetical protein
LSRNEIKLSTSNKKIKRRKGRPLKEGIEEEKVKKNIVTSDTKDTTLL